MKKALVTILKYVVFLGLGIWITYHMVSELSEQQRTDLLSAIENINLWYLLPIFVVGTLSHYFRALRWRYLLETIDLKPSVTNTMFAVMIGYITNLAIPRAGEVAKCTVLGRYEKMPAHKMVGTIVAERAFDLICLIVIAVFTFFIEMQRINSFVAEKVGSVAERLQRNQQTLTMGIVAVLVVGIVTYLIYRRVRKSKAGQLMEEMTHGILSIFRMKKKWQFMGYTVLMWVMYTLQIYIGLKCVSGTAEVPLMASLVVLVYGSVGLIATPGGIGAYPYLVAQILGAYAVSEVPAQAFGWIAWLAQTVLILLLGVASLILIHPYNKRKDAKAGLDNTEDTRP